LKFSYENATSCPYDPFEVKILVSTITCRKNRLET